MTDKAAATTEPEKQPLINQRAIKRLAIGLFIIAGLILGFQFLRGKALDPYGGGSKDSSGMVAAIMRTKDGARAVVIQPGGDVMLSPNHRPGANDRDLVWRPDG